MNSLYIKSYSYMTVFHQFTSFSHFHTRMHIFVQRLEGVLLIPWSTVNHSLYFETAIRTLFSGDGKVKFSKLSLLLCVRGFSISYNSQTSFFRNCLLLWLVPADTQDPTKWELLTHINCRNKLMVNPT